MTPEEFVAFFATSAMLALVRYVIHRSFFKKQFTT